MPSTPKAALPYPASSNSPNVPQDIQNLATAVDTKVIIPVASQAARDALGTTGNITVQRADTGDYESNYGGAWSRIAGPLIQAKAWRTSGFSATLTPNTLTTVDLTTARLSGGITFDATANTLTLPANGHYELRGRGYASGASGYFWDFRITRQRSAIADLDVVSQRASKPDGTNDEVMYFSDTVPLQAGDKLLLRCNFGTGSGGAQTYWGTSEITGVQIFARYVGPLSGATPI